ncbi:MAG TPA: hypothetical protein DEB39_03190 [Planctomycetaceae bacterium]|nr:hypothetical protein [Planctomycetaceae bacterium]
MTSSVFRHFLIIGIFGLGGLFASNGVFGSEYVDWEPWRSLPVFDEGRIMPLDTFARQIVQEICGTARPFIVVDDFLLEELDRMDSREDFEADELTARLRRTEEQERKERNRRMDEIRDQLMGDRAKYKAPAFEEEEPGDTDSAESFHSMESESRMQERLRNAKARDGRRIARRIRYLIPEGGRYFEPHELLFSWLTEPEIWDYLPFLPADDEFLRTEILDIRLRNQIGYRLRYAGIVQVERSAKYQQHLAGMREDAPKTRSELDKRILRIEHARAVFRDVVFRPDRDFPDRCASLVYAAIEGTPMQRCSLRMVVESLESLSALDMRDGRLTGTSAVNGLLREVVVKTRALGQWFEKQDAEGNPVFSHVVETERAFEEILLLSDRLAVLSATLMKNAWPEGTFPLPEGSSPHDPASDPVWQVALFDPGISPEKRREINQAIMQFHYAVGAFRIDIQAAYLALYDNGQCVRILPSLMKEAIRPVRDEPLPLQPWVSLQTVLFADSPMIRRFVDPEYPQRDDFVLPAPDNMTADNAAPDNTTAETPVESAVAGTTVEAATVPGMVVPGITTPDKMTVSESDPVGSSTLPSDLLSPGDSSEPITILTEALTRRESLSTNSTQRTRDVFRRLGEVYAMFGEYPDAEAQFGATLRIWISEIAATGKRIEPLREALLSTGSTTESILAKTAYPASDATMMEVRYSRLAPFFWMWVFAAVSIVFALFSLRAARARSEMIDAEPRRAGSREKEPASDFGAAGVFPNPFDHAGRVVMERASRRFGAEEILFWIAVVFLLLSVFVTFLGGAMRAWITGWAPITNMYETVVLMGFTAASIGLLYTFAPMIGPIFRQSRAWTMFPTPAAILRMLKRDDPWERDSRTSLFNICLAVPRVLLMLFVFWATLRVCYGEYVGQEGLFATVGQVLQTHDPIDRLVVVGCIGVVVWFLPRFLLMSAMVPFVLFRSDLLATEAGIVFDETSRSGLESSLSRLVEQNEVRDKGKSRSMQVAYRWWSGVFQEVAARKLFILVGASVALLAGLAASYNSEFNPQIRPLMAVLRSNFWLTVHVIAIIASYAAALISWGFAMVVLGFYTFGTYRRDSASSGKTTVHAPRICGVMTPYVLQMLRLSVLLLAVGTILGARWADYSWGRFWGWDPKEVWALVTLLYFMIILHGRLARLYGNFGLMTGASLGAIVVILTWYGVNYVFKSGMHAYGGGQDSNALWLLIAFIVFNVGWCALAVLRYNTERFGMSEEQGT